MIITTEKYTTSYGVEYNKAMRVKDLKQMLDQVDDDTLVLWPLRGNGWMNRADTVTQLEVVDVVTECRDNESDQDGYRRFYILNGTPFGAARKTFKGVTLT